MIKFSNVKNLRRGDYEKIAGILENGGVAIFPTDTLYGLCCDATNKKAVNRLLKIKGRQAGKKGTPVLVKNLKMLSNFAEVSLDQKKIISYAKVPTSFRLYTNKLAKECLEKGGTAFRIPNKDFIQNLFAYFKRPIVATSANIAGQVVIKDSRKYVDEFGDKSKLIDVIIFDKVNQRKKGSKIVDLTSEDKKVLRK